MIRLESSGLVCEIEPALGGCSAGLWLEGVPVLRSTRAPLASARQSGSYPLVPFSNRIERATLQWRGTSHPLVSNNAPEPHAIHGVGWQRPWTVLDSDDSFAMLAYEHPADAAWPFAFEAAGRWEMEPDKLPTTRRSSDGIDADCATLDVDHCFDGWTGVVQLRDELLRIRISSNLGRLVVFTNGSRDTIAIEPVSHVNNAINLVAAGADAATLGLSTLQPGETLTAQMSIEVERMK